jgi:hypothetical protein
VLLQHRGAIRRRNDGYDGQRILLGKSYDISCIDVTTGLYTTGASDVERWF